MTTQQKAQTIAVYDATADRMADKFNTLGDRRRDIERALKYIRKDNPRIVELGCGNGRDAAVILEHTNDYLGMDASAGLLDLAKQYVPTALFIFADYESFVFPQNVDVIFAFASLLHSDKDEFQDVLDRGHAALSPYGLFFLSLKEGAYREFEKIDEFGSRTFYLYSEANIKEMIAGKYSIVESTVSDRRGQSWLDMLVQKI